MNDITVRFLEVYEHLKSIKLVSGSADFAEKIGVSGSMMTEIVKGRSNVGIKIIQNTVKNFRHIVDGNYILSGEGKFPLPFKIPTTSKNLEEEYAVKNIGLPLIPLEAVAGFSKGNEQMVLAEECDYYYVPDFYGKADYLIKVSGSSMAPKYHNGDILACKKLPLDTFFQWNKVYVLDTVQGPLVKRIKKSKEPGHIMLVSDNERYEPFEISLNAVNALALVIGVIRLE